MSGTTSPFRRRYLANLEHHRLMKFFMASLVALCTLLTACDNTGPTADATSAPRYGPEDLQALLQGAWLREYGDNSVQARRILVLSADGSFAETVRIADAAGQVTAQNHTGTWLYDGTNLKRKYTSMNGKPPSRLNLPFATFEIQLESKNEFTGIDHVHRNRIRYRRVSPETVP
ncbi:hypothetical protein [Polaromonas sp.]|uniref:hypothetical protein n=1 Tax=Polaromonas sp. TaxID=1869339 RepID=UPI0018076D6E|nr:hypothetical protein [Polaromonas sp.]NML85830.1 hypothetical protein [Polaromonas sp.]